MVEKRQVIHENFNQIMGNSCYYPQLYEEMKIPSLQKHQYSSILCKLACLSDAGII